MDCKICNKIFSGIECFQQHVASEKHKKKVLQHRNSMPSQSVGPFALPSTPGNQNTVPTTFPCATCAMNFLTLSEFTEHAGSEEHARMILSKKATESKIMENINSSARDCNINSTMQDLPLNDNFNAVASWRPRCEKCDKNFSGPEPYQQHIVSLAHKKKCGLLPASGNLVEVSSSTCSSLSCETCRVRFTGPESYQDHMRSIRHQKKVLASSNSVNESSKENTTPKLIGILQCETCNKSFSGPFQYEQHLESEVHKKVVDRSYYLKKFSEKEKSSTSSGLSVELPEKPNGLVSSFAWYCEVCHIQCSGIDPYRQHMASKGHGKKEMMAGAVAKRDELHSLFSGQTSSLDSSGQASKQGVSHAEIDGINRSRNTAAGDLGQEVKMSLYGDDWNVKTCTPSDLDLTFFAVGEEIDFDKNSKIKIEVKDLDMVDAKEEENEEMDE